MKAQGFAEAVTAGGLVLRCSREGLVRAVQRDDHGVAQGIEGNVRFTALFDEESRARACRFLATVEAEGSAFDWKLDAMGADGLVLLRCAGVSLGNELLIVAVGSGPTNPHVCQDLAEINRTQLDQLHEAALARAADARTRHQHSQQLEELMRLNDDLAAAQRELALRNDELDMLNRQKNQFLGMAAHDLRNPLGVILGYSEILLEASGEVLDEDQRQLLSTIRESSEFMVWLIGDLLDIAKIESGTVQLDVRPTDLAALLRRTVALNQLLAGRKRIRLLAECDDGLADVPLDAGKIVQVLNNLITNAIKFSQPGTTVHVRLERRGDEAVLSVADEGPGIPEQERLQLFQPFAMSSVRPTAGETSTGLGLAIVKKEVEGHCGRIWVESEIGHGSTFFVALPLSRGTAAAAPDAQADRGAPPAHATLDVLVADDDAVSRHLVRRFLERHGHRVTIACDGQEAVEACRGRRFDIVLMDVEMPMMNGIDATAAIREHEATTGEHQVILALSDHGGLVPGRCRHAGMDDYLCKPFRVRDLLEAYERLQR